MAGTSNALGRFFKTIFAVLRFIRSVFLNLILLFVVLAMFGAFMGNPPVVIGKASILLLDPHGSIVEQRNTSDPLSLLTASSGANPSRQILLQDVLDAIAAAKTDERITSMLIDTDHLTGAGMSQLQDIGTAIADFKTTGKKVIAVGDSYSQAEYLLASYADEILLNNYGGVSLEGFGIFSNYFQEAITKLGVNVHIFRVGTYKSAVEPYMRNDMSPETKSNYSTLLGDLWTHYVTEIENRRQLPAGTVNDFINNIDQHLSEHNGDTAELAKALRLVDRIDSRTALTDYLRETMGSDKATPLRTISFENYLEGDIPSKPEGGAHVALIVAEGEIVDGEAPPGTIGGDTLGAMIRGVTNNKEIKALVLRVNSPGGSAFASEIIRTELAAFKASGRPIVVSMGDTAASGGYWISTSADQIWASPLTITGSIGIFGMIPTFEESAKKLGVGTDGVGTTTLAGQGTVGLPLSDVQARAIQLEINHGYERFISLVAAARDKDNAAVDAIAQGQVWSGLSAKANGLVDELGSLEQAIAAAAKLANLERYRVDLIQPTLSPTQRFLQDILENVHVQSALQPLVSSLLPRSLLLQQLQYLEAPLHWLQSANDPKFHYVRCLECTALQW